MDTATKIKTAAHSAEIEVIRTRGRYGLPIVEACVFVRGERNPVTKDYVTGRAAAMLAHTLAGLAEALTPKGEKWAIDLNDMRHGEIYPGAWGVCAIVQIEPMSTSTAEQDRANECLLAAIAELRA